MYYRERLRSFLFLHVRACQFFCAISFASFAHLQEVSLDASMGTFTQKLVFEMFVWPLKSVPMCFNAFLYTVFSSAGGVAKASTKGKGDVIFSAFFIIKVNAQQFWYEPFDGLFYFPHILFSLQFCKTVLRLPCSTFLMIITFIDVDAVHRWVLCHSYYDCNAFAFLPFLLLLPWLFRILFLLSLRWVNGPFFLVFVFF